ncbi:hypothetical protein CspHIS471_0700840 [Cutaneotrichosporon sp. HIS471]|nr:hypothetical protein CspHIS471_0700840 [Cutaneotrichosporon sp. HIS471]
MAGTDFTLQILRTVVTLVTVLCYTVTSCFVIARISSPLTSILPLPLLAVLYLNFDGPKPSPPQQISHVRTRGSWSAATGDTGDKWPLDKQLERDGLSLIGAHCTNLSSSLCG